MNSKDLAKRIRIHSLRMTNSGESSHIGAAFSIADILAVLYNNILKIDPKSPDNPDRDRFILSKGHAGVAVYSTLAEMGFFKIDKLKTHCQDGSDLCGHISHKGIPGVEVSTGSLGHGLSIAAGMSLAAILNKGRHRIFVLLSDGECDEGSTWEAALFAAHHQLNNLTAIIDYNKMQSLAPVSETLGLEPFNAKWQSFGWNVQEIDGHNYEQIEKALIESPIKNQSPNVIIAHTTKGKGVSFMENQVLWHYRCPKGAEYEAALKELENQR